MNIKLTRLPDINTDRQLQDTPYISYGRFAVGQNGGFWFGDLRSSHPPATNTGWYWAVGQDGTLFVSARGAGIDGEALVAGKYKPVLALLIEELVKRRKIKKPRSITIQQ